MQPYAGPIISSQAATFGTIFSQYPGTQGMMRQAAASIRGGVEPQYLAQDCLQPISLSEARSLFQSGAVRMGITSTLQLNTTDTIYAATFHSLSDSESQYTGAEVILQYDSDTLDLSITKTTLRKTQLEAGTLQGLYGPEENLYSPNPIDNEYGVERSFIDIGTAYQILVRRQGCQALLPGFAQRRILEDFQRAIDLLSSPPFLLYHLDLYLATNAESLGLPVPPELAPKNLSYIQIGGGIANTTQEQFDADYQAYTAANTVLRQQLVASIMAAINGLP